MTVAQRYRTHIRGADRHHALCGVVVFSHSLARQPELATCAKCQDIADRFQWSESHQPIYWPARH